mmetsp:Transcript_14034/g.33482  ORF Transcript_14034/g.33482 Transcript_14034/m.33482 type:complete len:223 (+) Transcript_14034:23-691(+)
MMLCPLGLRSLALFLTVWVVAGAGFGGCPPIEQVQKAEVVKTYNVSRSQGRFFEIFVKDVVEAPCTCFLKDRRVNDKGLQDSDQLYCGAGKYMSWYNVTEDNFFISGHNARFDLVFQSPIMRRIVFPNVVLGFAEAGGHTGYTWLVEYQCMERLGVQTYLGFNIYHRHWDPPEADVLAIRRVIEEAGLGEHWASIKRMGGPHCNYTSSPPAATFQSSRALLV